jgi:hypothetical protein
MKTKPASTVVKKKTATRAARPRRVARATTAAAKSKTAGRTRRRRKKIEVAPLLLEGDRPVLPLSGPGQKYALGPTPPAQQFETENGELPESYGTKKLFLTARDPHWLYVHWDLTRAQQSRGNAGSAAGHLILRIFAEGFEGRLVSEIHVHPESRHWFVHVERGGTKYAAELGYYRAHGKWTRVSISDATFTPPDDISPEAEVEFATIPVELPFPKLLAIIKEAMPENLPLARAVGELRRAGHPGLPSVVTTEMPDWTPQQEQALAQLIGVDQMRRVGMSSLEITELIRRRLAHEISSAGVSSLSSPFGGVGRFKGFWFSVNAELIVYGATEPTAKVTLDGQEVKLRPDGSFNFRFALPDGKYELPAVAVSADGTDARAANLKFSRETKHHGDIGAQPQDPALKPPSTETSDAA